MSEKAKKKLSAETEEQARTVSENGQDVVASEAGGMGETAAEDAGAEAPKRNKYADRMNKKKSRLSKKAQIIICAAIAALFIAGGIFAVVKTRGGASDDSSDSTAAASRGMLETYVEGSGSTAAKKREELGRDLKGTISEVLVEVGDEVKAGDRLVVVNPTETKKELKTAQEELTNAYRSVTDAQAEVTSAQNSVSAAQKKLSKLTVTAPFTGKIIPVTDSDGNSTDYRVGQQLSEGEVIGYMVDDSTMKLSLYYSAAYANAIKSGQTATVSIPAAMSSVSGTVSSVESAQRISTDGVKMFRVVLSVKNPGTLTKGMLATATISTAAQGEVYPAESGTLEYGREEAVTIQTGGEIKTLNGVDYYSYAGGATIMTLTSDSAQDELKSAQSNVVTAQNGVENAQKQVESKKEQIAELEKLIEGSTITSPIDGVVVSLNAYEEQEVGGTDALVVVADLNDIIVNAYIQATDVSEVQAGQSATMTMYTSDGSVTMTGTVESVALEPAQDSNSSQGSMPTFPAVIAIDPVEGQSISIGMSVDYQITTASSEDCLIVPSSAIVYTDTGTAVFAQPLKDESGKEIPFDNALPIPEGTEGVPADFQLVPVETGISDSSSTEIVSGIEEGVTVYLAGPQDMYASYDMGVG